MLQQHPPFLDAPPLQRYGIPSYVIGTNPAAAGSFTRTVDGGVFERYVAISCRLVTDANVANREVVVQYRDSDGNVIDQNGINSVVTAGSTEDFFFNAFQPLVVVTVNSSALIPLHPVMLLPTWSMRILLVNAQAGDQLSRIRLVLEQFYSDADVPGREPWEY